MLIPDLADYIHAPIAYDGKDASTIEIHGVSGLMEAQKGDIAFFEGGNLNEYLCMTSASALIVRKVEKAFSGPQLISPNPRFAYAKLAMMFYRVDHGISGIHPTAIVEDDVILGKDVVIGAYTYIGSGTVIGDRCVIYPHVYIGMNCEIGSDSVIHPNNVIYFGSRIGLRCLIHAGCVIGADGFGFAVNSGEICKIPQMGIVVIEDDVELGACVTIDRAANGETLVKRGSKFDDKVHIGHNAEVGENCMFSAFAGIAGSTKVGDRVLMGGHAGISDHLTVADNVRIAAKAGVIHDIETAGIYSGFPAKPINEWKREVIQLRNMRLYVERVRRLEQRLERLECNGQASDQSRHKK
jgi:UDP-3-O-[3-hydroxymyristoyl] glucosamine N-acyltransferase